MPVKSALIAALATTALLVAGCHRPQGALMAYTGGSYTYFSYETAPKTVRVLDMRTNEIVFSMDVPVGKQLTIEFLAGKGDDPVYSPDAMRYEVLEMGTTTGKLRNQMSVPAGPSRKIEVELRQGPEYVTPVPERMLRTDEVQDRPDWWSPRGGEMPADRKGISNYDK